MPAYRKLLERLSFSDVENYVGLKEGVQFLIRYPEFADEVPDYVGPSIASSNGRSLYIQTARWKRGILILARGSLRASCTR